MADFQTVAAVVFLVLLTLFIFVKRKQMYTQKILFPLLYFSMYKTKVGLKLMDNISKKFRKPLAFMGYFGIFVCFLGMAMISFALIQNIYVLFTKPETLPGVGLVLPFKVKGVFFVPFFYWIISIFVIALVHEFSHGILARTHNLKIKSSGFAFLGILIPVIPAAFVEPDEKELKKRPHKQQLSVFAAGPFSNILLAFLIIIFSYLLIAPIVNSIIELDGVKITGFVENDKKYPAELAGIEAGEIVEEINGIPVKSLENFSSILQNKSPGNVIKLKTNSSVYKITLAENPESRNASYLGVYVQQNTEIKESIQQSYGKFLPLSIMWVVGLLNILVILNLGIGLFNLVPIGPLDGGRMLQLVLHRLFDKERGDKIWKYVGIFFLTLVFINIAFSFVR